MGAKDSPLRRGVASAGEQGARRGRIADRLGTCAGGDPLGELREHVPGTCLHERVHAEPDQCLDAGDPAHRRDDVAAEEVPAGSFSMRHAPLANRRITVRARANAIAPIFEAGMVWAPDTEWAEQLVEECAAFPNGDNDDMVDVTTMALMRFRQGGFLRLPTDEPEEIEWFRSPRKERYYTV